MSIRITTNMKYSIDRLLKKMKQSSIINGLKCIFCAEETKVSSRTMTQVLMLT